MNKSKFWFLSLLRLIDNLEGDGPNKRTGD